MQSVSQRVAAKVMREAKPKRSPDNKTSLLRAQANKRKVRGSGLSELSDGPSRAGYGSFDSRSRSVLPPIASVRNSDRKSNLFGDEKDAFRERNRSIDYASPNIKLQGRNTKKLESISEQRSVYKLDKQYAAGGTPRNNHGPDSDANSVEKLFKNMRIQDRSEILDKIHAMRLHALDKRGYEDLAKPHLPTLGTNEKDKIVEQYFAAKKQLSKAQAMHSGHKPTHERMSSIGSASGIPSNIH